MLRLLEVGDVLPHLEDRGAVLVVEQVARVPDDPAARCRPGRRPGSRSRGMGVPAMTRGNSSATAAAVGLGQEQRRVIAAVDLRCRVAGQVFGERAEVDDRVVGAKDDDQALGRLDQVAERGLAPLLGQRQPLPLGDPRAGWRGVRRR